MKEIILKVDKNDRVIGEIEKGKAHKGKGILHRAFFVIIFNKGGKILLAKRSKHKKLWPGFWEGTVASHQRKGETLEEAIKRRVKEEIGIKIQKIKSLLKFYYQDFFEKEGVENEICHVVKVKCQGKAFPNKKEVSRIKWIILKNLKKDVKENPHKYTPWFLISFRRIFR